jgi:hypothetical protein
MLQGGKGRESQIPMKHFSPYLNPMVSVISKVKDSALLVAIYTCNAHQNYTPPPISSSCSPSNHRPFEIFAPQRRLTMQVYYEYPCEDRFVIVIGQRDHRLCPPQEVPHRYA